MLSGRLTPKASSGCTITVQMNTSSLNASATQSSLDPGSRRPLLQEQHERIFERFYRAIDASRQGFPGLGIGLYLVALLQRIPIRAEKDNRT